MKYYVFFVLLIFTIFIEITVHSTVINVSTQENFGKLISSKKITIAKFYTTWCGACIASEKPFVELSDSPSTINAQFITIDIDTIPELAREYGINYIPQFLIFKDGKFIKKQEFINIEAFSKEIISTISTLENNNAEDGLEQSLHKGVYSHHGTNQESNWFESIFDFVMVPIYFVLNILERIIEAIKGLIR